MEKCPINFCHFYYPNLILVAPLTWNKEICHVLMSHVITAAWGGVPNGTLSMMFTSCPNVMFVTSLWQKIYRFSNWLFCYFEQFRADIYFANFGQVRTDPIFSLLLTLDRSVILPSLGKLCWENQSKPSPFDKNSRIMHRIWHKLFS